MAQLRLFKQPLGGWPKDPALKTVGRYLQVSCETGFEAYSLTHVLGKSNEDVAQIIQGAIQDIRDRRIHSYIYLYVQIRTILPLGYYLLTTVL